MMINCSLCGEKSDSIHSVCINENEEEINNIVDYCENCEEAYIQNLYENMERR
tara:strand:- start:192 stop:350 length:159 start_codon:yes stop_codon:yes gene_type:complete